MSLPELIANSPSPGIVTALTKLKAELKAGAKELETEAAAPSALHAEGQFRIVLGSEILLIEGPSAATAKWKILERAVEGSTEAAHAVGASVYNYLTAGALKTLFVAQAPTINSEPVLMHFGGYEGPGVKYPGVITANGYVFGQTATPAGSRPQLEIGKLEARNEEVSTKGMVSLSLASESGDAVALLVGGVTLANGEVWAANLIGEIAAPKTKVTGCEIDFGYKNNAARPEPVYNCNAYGLTIQYLPRGFQGVNPQPYIQIGLKQHQAKKVTFKGTLKSGSNTITGVVVEEGIEHNTIANLSAEQELSGEGIPKGTTIKEVIASKGEVVMSALVEGEGVKTITSKEVPLKVKFEATTTEGSSKLTNVTNFLNLSVGMTVTGPGIPAGTVVGPGVGGPGIDEATKEVQLSANATATASSVKLEAEGKENQGCLYGIRFLGEASGANLISPEGTAIDFHNLGTCKYGIDFETNVFTGAALHFGAGTSRQFAWTSAEPTVTGSKSGNEALKSLLEKLAAIGLIKNETT